MPRYLDPKNDLVFKKIFGEHPDLLIDFLNALLPLPPDALIESLEYLPQEQVPVLPGLLRRSIVDVKCRDRRGQTFIVEMQMYWTPAFQQRMLFSASQAYVQQLPAGSDYRLLQPVYALGLINDIFDRASEAWYHHYKIVNIDKPAMEIKGLQFVFVELPKFRPETVKDKRIMVLWLRFLREVDPGVFDPPQELIDYEPTRDALQIAMEAGFSRDELLVYQDCLDAIRVESTLFGERTEMAREEGREKGREEGLKEGEYAKALEIASNLLDILDDATLAAKTGLDLEAIARLRQER